MSQKFCWQMSTGFCRAMSLSSSNPFNYLETIPEEGMVFTG
jgi:hypothetical protein